MNKRDCILTEATRLFGRLGYLGFTLKQLAQACDMTAPALYYFYSSKADLFKDCLLSEFAARQRVLEACAERASTLPEFAETLVETAFEVCGVNDFCTGEAMEELVHLPEEMQQELRQAWREQLITPVVNFLTRIGYPAQGRIALDLLATFIINIATFAASREGEFDRTALAALSAAAAQGIDSTITAPAP
jgi:AcrR family transcriptional regulator